MIAAGQRVEGLDLGLLDRVVETDRVYFELGAQVESLAGASLAWMPGLTDCPASTVIHRVDPDAMMRGGRRWIEQVEQRLADIGVGLARIYCDARGPADNVLREAGYTDREELAFVHQFGPDEPQLALRPVTDDADWAMKLALHDALGGSPDGHCNEARDWIALERRKAGTALQPYLALSDGKVVGAICGLWGADLLRLKNIVIHPRHRRRALGHAMLASLAGIGRQRGLTEQGVFAVGGSSGESFYRALGMREVGRQIEWSKMLSGGAQ
ncbi:GNAT family N-acetyltransferase [Sphingomonas xanthus]|uniref:GNAT family N-acetyltransferase n=1 Tax=Sphingomonas xanthus TaxID=2594473 RepID=A0A516IQM0_9SPHN|nr:GNAT family N-acetyltransferase [Sphingomonas xanthus]QDP19210.1 GNAT family N-acetyltransferase [Sphingomonas xanthus]